MNKLDPMPQKRPIVFFDFDGTLTQGDSLMPFLKYVHGPVKYYSKLLWVIPFLIGYLAKLIPNDVAKQRVLKHYLKNYRLEELFVLGKQFSFDVIPSLLRPKAMKRLKLHQDLGHECILVSASLEVYLLEWARSHNFNGVLCSRLRQDSFGTVTGELEGENCYGLEKVRRIEQSGYLKQNRESFAYGDTVGDLPMLCLVDHPLILENDKFNLN
jgi:phosphatidylglycerophosphatase C